MIIRILIDISTQNFLARPFPTRYFQYDYMVIQYIRIYYKLQSIQNTYSDFVILNNNNVNIVIVAQFFHHVQYLRNDNIMDAFNTTIAH